MWASRFLTFGIVVCAALLLAACDPVCNDVADSSRNGSKSGGSPPIALKGGEWVVVSDGRGSSGIRIGGSWYLLRFDQDSTAQLLWVEQGHYARECVAFSQTGNVVAIAGAVAAPHLNGIPFTVNENSMTGVIPRSGYEQKLAFTNRSIAWPYVHFDLVCIGLMAAISVWRYSKNCTLIALGCSVFVMIKYWITESGVTSNFRWIEVSAIFLSIALFWVVRFTSFRRNKTMRALIVAVLVFSMLAAIKVDFLTGYLPNMLNGFAGILAIFSINSWNTIGLSQSPTADLIWPSQPFGWVIAFSVWNTTFSYLNFNEYTSYAIAINAVAILFSLCIPGIWLFARGIALGFFYTYFFTFNHFVLQQSFIPVPITDATALAVAAISFGLNLLLCIFVWCRKISGSRLILLPEKWFSVKRRTD